MFKFMKYALCLFILSFALSARAQTIDQLYKKYSSKNYIVDTRLEGLKSDSERRMNAILKYMAAAHKAALKRSFSSKVKEANEKRREFRSLQILLNKVSPINKKRMTNKEEGQ